MRKRGSRTLEPMEIVVCVRRRGSWPRGLACRGALVFKLTPAALCCAATLPIMVLLASSPASAQFACMTTTNIDCTNTGPNGAGSNTVTGTLNVTNTNSGTNTGGINTVTTAGGSV